MICKLYLNKAFKKNNKKISRKTLFWEVQKYTYKKNKKQKLFQQVKNKRVLP